MSDEDFKKQLEKVFNAKLPEVFNLIENYKKEPYIIHIYGEFGEFLVYLSTQELNELNKYEGRFCTIIGTDQLKFSEFIDKINLQINKRKLNNDELTIKEEKQMIEHNEIYDERGNRKCRICDKEDCDKHWKKEVFQCNACKFYTLNNKLFLKHNSSQKHFKKIAAQNEVE